MTYWSNHCSAIVLTDKLSSQSLGYAFAQNLMRHYKAERDSKKEVMAMISGLRSL